MLHPLQTGSSLTSVNALRGVVVAWEPGKASIAAPALPSPAAPVAKIGAGRTFTSAIRRGDVVFMAIGTAVRGALVVREPSSA